jgi:hypothetical protein
MLFLVRSSLSRRCKVGTTGSKGTTNGPLKMVKESYRYSEFSLFGSRAFFDSRIAVPLWSMEDRTAE